MVRGQIDEKRDKGTNEALTDRRRENEKTI